MTPPLPAPDEVPALEMINVAVGALHDPAIRVAENINWTVRPGDYWVIAGLHGAGKSDFLRLAGGVMPPQQGQYRFFGEPMPIFEDARLPTRLRLGLVFDGGQLFNHLTLAENVALPLRYHRNLGHAEAAAAAAELLAGLELEPWAHRLPGAVGYGWRKRAGLARALALQPEVLLVDNPLGGVDPRQVHWWLAFLDQLSRGHPLLRGRPVTLVVTAADFPRWQGHARQFALLRDRRLRVLGGWGEVAAAREDAVRELLTKETQTG
ncbi:MAG TPA: ATP-binding cassette domain-containing protein [Verrucomicrobiota bacterium]|nr:ATP-binding cassette domain-containing protein [Verrucomicrobiota bacterium]OQC24145.1 MAG: Lipoprotein-releasing system ATP-binding protein LolD [Verrucomicrobia bacterium ADurb.Bin063]HRR65052.1 ATP-binding cassette domain-containing protein [Candidatus Paceibacterota bacterium]MBP8015727.1 ATP-binding cassette domain-containing protein [Verrucomicrobiota bacterium]MDI9373991.1 ATP-binding cassette domain-containing protein [Verrucomicrobiota bacterium]